MLLPFHLGSVLLLSDDTLDCARNAVVVSSEATADENHAAPLPWQQDAALELSGADTSDEVNEQSWELAFQNAITNMEDTEYPSSSAQVQAAYHAQLDTYNDAAAELNQYPRFASDRPNQLDLSHLQDSQAVLQSKRTSNQEYAARLI
ncbi:MAG: hypothetical protein M1829_002377 [Trizodia sp. TS-e1964]|nr:MAG: hypothetical protein M1829_002377 [Trizodia sp. TS-e1964]